MKDPSKVHVSKQAYKQFGSSANMNINHCLVYVLSSCENQPLKEGIGENMCLLHSKTSKKQQLISLPCFLVL